MALQLSVAVRNGRADAVETVVGASPTIEFRTGNPPADCAAADTGTLIASLTLPADWMAASANGFKEKSGTWTDPIADNAGTVGHFRLKQGGTCHMQGTVTMSGGGGDMIIVNNNVAAGQSVEILTYQWTEPNA